jgi:hypothetical protein
MNTTTTGSQQPKQPRIVPTTGRKVWYWPDSQDIEAGGAIMIDPTKPCDATICFVHGNGTVNLSWSDQECRRSEALEIPLYMPEEVTDEMRYTGGIAQWMPFQAQAAMPTTVELTK